MRKVMTFTLGMLAAGLVPLPASAEVITSPTKALRLLTEARVAAEKCGYLTPAARRELIDYAAQAELVAVRRAGAAAARQALREGRRQGAASCSEEKRELVQAVLHGAREAVRKARVRPAVAEARQRPRPAPRRQVAPRTIRRTMTAQPQRVAWRARTWDAHAANVRAYIALASAYYTALKCRNRPQAELLRMWRQVRRAHYDLLRQAGGAVVARAKRTAARRGNARACF